MSCKETRRKFIEEVVRTGCDPASVEFVQSLDLKKAWFERLHRVPNPILRKIPRVVNHFTIGADPEFMMTDLNDQLRRAVDFGLRPGTAFGGDQNGRLVEIRPHPDTFALKVLASTWATMKWMAALMPECRPLIWTAPPFKHRDGIGGHVHLARKTPNKEKEVKALDIVTNLMLNIGVFDSDGNRERVAGDQFGQRYGRWGDTRNQNHGYEYRVMPSWLDSPLTAYMALVLSKLAAMEWGMLTQSTKPRNGIEAENRVRNLLAKFQGLDDDARILYKAIERAGIPRFRGGDFKPRWGLNFNMLLKAPKVTLLPSSIEAEKDEVCQMFMHLVHGEALPAVVGKVTWKSELPAGYVPMEPTARWMGDALAGLVRHVDYPFTLHESRNSVTLVSTSLMSLMPHNATDIVHSLLGGKYRIEDTPDLDYRVYLPADFRVGLLTRLRDFLKALFPVWEGATVEKDSIKKYLGRAKQESKHMKVIAEL